MNTLVDFLKSRFGLGALVISCILIVSFFWPGSRPAKPHPIPLLVNTNALTQFRASVSSIPTPKPVVMPAPPVSSTNAPKRSVIFTIDVTITNSVPTIFAPAGDMLRCVLVNTIESIRIDTPVIGIVTDDVWFNGKLVVPAKSKVIGKAQVDRVRDRIAANGTWTLVFPTGEELLVEGIALHCDDTSDTKHWRSDDGSSGFKGKVIKNISLDEIKLFAASFLSGMSRGLQQTETTIFGSQVRQSLKNGALAGSGAVLDEYARSIAETIKRDGVYVRVERGSQFYVFLPHTLDRSAARIGATRRVTSTP